METKNYFSTDAAGNIIPGATCYLYLPGTQTTAVGITNINGQPLANPFTAATSGLVQFKAPDGEYDLRVVGGGREFTIRIQCFDGVAFLAQIEAGGAGLIQYSRDAAFDRGTIGSKLQDSISVTDQPYGADGTPTKDAAAFQAVYADAVAGQVIDVPWIGKPYQPGTVTGTKEVTWRVKFNTADNLALLNLPGTILSMHNDSQMTWKAKSKATDFANARFDRQANHTGGTVGAVSANIWAKTSVADGVIGFEWVNLNWLVNNGQGENCAGYDKADRYAGAKVGRGTFGRVVEARDYTGEANPTTALVAMEVDVFANGTDDNNLRIGTDYVAGKGLPGGATSQAGYAIRIGASNNDPTLGYFKNPILLQHRKQVGLRVIGTTDAYSFESADTAVAAIKLGGTYSDSAQIIDGTAVVGTRYSGTFTNNNAIRFNSGMAIAWEATTQIRQLFGGGRMQFVNGGTEKTGFDTTTGAMFITGTQVVGPRKTGWAADTGTAKRTASATFLQTAPAAYTQASQQAVNDALASVTQAMKALKDDLLSTAGHGLIGA